MHLVHENCIEVFISMRNYDYVLLELILKKWLKYVLYQNFCIKIQDFISKDNSKNVL